MLTEAVKSQVLIEKAAVYEKVQILDRVLIPGNFVMNQIDPRHLGTNYMVFCIIFQIILCGNLL